MEKIRRRGNNVSQNSETKSKAKDDMLKRNSVRSKVTEDIDKRGDSQCHT